MPEQTNTPKVDRLMFAVLQEQDVETASRALRKAHIFSTRLPSTGGYLGRRSTTLLIGFAKEVEETILNALRKTCRTRVEYVTIPLEGTPLPVPAPTPITVGGASIFTLEVERFEVF